MKRIAHLLAAFVVASSVVPLVGQPQADPKPPAFEVASVKPAKTEALLQKGFSCSTPSRERFSGFGRLRFFIACAYDIPWARASQQIVGSPAWIDDDLFEIEATTTSDHLLASPSEVRGVLQSLLADRFRLAVHRETRQTPAYALVIARRDGRLGPNLRPIQTNCGDWIAGGRRGAPPPIPGDLPCGRQTVSAFAFRSSAMPFSQLVNLLAGRVERPVHDQTNLSGVFAIDLRWRPEQSTSDTNVSDDLPTSIFTALQEQLGLKLEPTKVPVDVLVIDHVQRPTPD